MGGRHELLARSALGHFFAGGFERGAFARGEALDAPRGNFVKNRVHVGFGNFIGVLGGWAVCHFALDFNTAGYVLRALESADTWDLYSGMIKSAVFAWIIITIACNAGLHVEGGAEGVGQATTASVVQALLAMLVTNAILTAVFFFGA